MHIRHNHRFWIETIEQEATYRHLNMLKQVFPTQAVIMFNNTKTTLTRQPLHVQMETQQNDDFTPIY
jgi:hypothetical protein